MRFKFAHSGRMRILDHNKILWSCEHANRLGMTNARQSQTVSAEHQLLMLNLCDSILSITKPFKRIVYSDWQYFYTNDKDIFDNLSSMPGVQHVHYADAVVNKPRDVVILANSQYQWRTYFRDRTFSREQSQLLANFITQRPQQFRITANWRERLSRSWFYIYGGFFVDHHNQHDSLLLNMVLPGCVRKTLPIESRQ